MGNSARDEGSVAAYEMPEFTLTSSPVATLQPGPVTLVVGLEDEPDGALRVYLGARYKGVYLRVHPDDPAQSEFRRAWGWGRHVWMYPVPPPDVLHRDEPVTADA